MINLPKITDALRFRQEQYAYTQKKMAQVLGLHQSHYSEILNGKRSLPYSAAIRAYEIGVPPKVLLQPKMQL